MQVDITDVNVLEEGVKLYDSLLEDDSPINLDRIGDFPLLNDLAESVTNVIRKLESSKLYRLWILYLDMIDLLTYNTVVERTGNLLLVT